MKTSITAIEKASWNTPLVLRGSFEESIHEAARLGYDGIELHVFDSDALDHTALKQSLADNQICLTSIGTGPSYSQNRLFFTSTDPEIRAKALQRMKGHIHLGAETGAVVIIGLIKGQKKDVNDDAAYMDLFYDSMSICVSEAEKYGVTLAFEVIDRYESDWLNTIDEGLGLLDSIGSANLTLHLDTYHMNIEEANLYDAVLRAKGRIGHVHVADTDRWYPGHGHYNFEELFRSLKDAEYNRAIALESFPYPDIETCARKNLEKIKSYFV